MRLGPPLLSLLLPLGCQGGGGSAPASVNVSAVPPGALPVAPRPTQQPSVAAPAGRPGTVSVLQMSLSPPGATGTVRGLFLGWKGPCRSAPPTRSAWQLADTDRANAPCLYVDGPLPDGVDPDGTPSAPVWVRVEARLEGADQDRYLSAKRVERDAP